MFKAIFSTLRFIMLILAGHKEIALENAALPPETRNIVAIPEVGGLHHRYERRAA